MQLQESGEMYLETILVLKEKNDRIRAIDISEEMGFSKPSVSRAMGLLKEGGYITVNADGYINLTDEGERVSRKIYERHKILTEFLVSLGVKKESADQDACKIEHVISDSTFEAIKEYTMKI